MRFELDLVRPLAASLDPEHQLRDATQCRRNLRLVSETVVQSLQENHKHGLAQTTVRLMMTTAEVLLCQNVDPQVPDLVTAATALICSARNAMDKALQVNDPVQLAAAAVMMELVTRGIHATLSMPYEKLFAAEVACEDLVPILYGTPQAGDSAAAGTPHTGGVDRSGGV